MGEESRGAFNGGRGRSARWHQGGKRIPLKVALYIVIVVVIMETDPLPPPVRGRYSDFGGVYFRRQTREITTRSTWNAPDITSIGFDGTNTRVHGRVYDGPLRIRPPPGVHGRPQTSCAAIFVFVFRFFFFFYRQNTPEPIFRRAIHAAGDTWNKRTQCSRRGRKK